LILKEAKSSLENVVDLTVFLVDMVHYDEFNQVYNEYFDAETGPTRTTVAVKQLPNPRLLIEIKAIALANE
jgi:2-aminomuconate deaminase